MAGNPNTVNNLMKNRDAIRKIMAMEGKMNEIAKDARDNGSLSMGEDGITYNAAPLTEEQQMQAQTTQAAQQIVVNEAVMQKHAHMPKKILESFQQNPGKDAPLPSGMGGSVLDGLNIPNTTTKQPIQESSPVSQPIVTTSASAPIDYSLLKTIINEAVETNVKKYVSAMYKKLMNEGKGGSSLAAMKIGEKGFSLISEDGSIYSCKPTFKRNINQVND